MDTFHHSILMLWSCGFYYETVISEKEELYSRTGALLLYFFTDLTSGNAQSPERCAKLRMQKCAHEYVAGQSHAVSRLLRGAETIEDA